MKRHRRIIALTSLLCLLPAGLAMGQGQQVERFDRQLEQIRRETRLRADEGFSLSERTQFDYGAYTVFNYLTFDTPATDENNQSVVQNRGVREYDLTAYAHLNMDGVHDVFVRGRGFYRDFNNGDSFDEHGNGFDGRLERAYYKFDLERYLASSKGEQASGNLTVKLGRDLTVWANGLTLSTELDGAVIDFEYGRATLQLVAGVTPPDTVDFDSSRPNFDIHTRRGFFGALATTRVAEKHRPFVYALIQRDYNNDDAYPIDVGGTTFPTRFEYNSYYLGIGSTGALTDRLAYGVELVYEGGQTLSDSVDQDSGNPTSQTKDDIQAWALDAQLDYLFPDERRTRMGGELILASGDSDRGSSSETFFGNQPGTNDHAFNAFGLLNTGLAFAPTPSNLIALRGSISTFPFPEIKSLRRLQIGTDQFLFAKFTENGPINEPTTDDRFLGFESDIFLNWQITSDVALALRYGAFVPGEAIIADERIRQFFYAGVTFAF